MTINFLTIIFLQSRESFDKMELDAQTENLLKNIYSVHFR